MIDRQLMKYSGVFRRYGINSTWLLAEKGASLVMGVVATALVARYLGPTEFGVLSYAVALSTLVGLVGDFGLGGVVIREIVRESARLDVSLGTTFVLKLVGYCLGVVVLWGVSLFAIPPGGIDRKVIMIVAMSLPFRAVFDVIQCWFFSQVEAKYVTLARLGGLVLSTGYRLIMIAAGAALIMFPWAHPLMSCAASITMTWFYRQQARIGIRSWRFSSVRAKFLLKQSWAAFTGYLFANLYISLDQIMLRWLVDSTEVALYSVSASKLQALAFFPVAIVGSIFPRLVSLRDQDQATYGRRLQQSFDFLCTSGTLMAVVLTVVATPLILLIYGEAYAGSSKILTVHGWMLPFVFVRVLFGRWIHIEECSMLSLRTQAIGVVTNILLNVLLIPIYGAYGAAVGTLIAYMVGSYWSLAIYRKSRPMFRIITGSLLLSR